MTAEKEWVELQVERLEGIGAERRAANPSFFTADLVGWTELTPTGRKISAAMIPMPKLKGRTGPNKNHVILPSVGEHERAAAKAMFDAIIATDSPDLAGLLDAQLVE